MNTPARRTTYIKAAVLCLLAAAAVCLGTVAIFSNSPGAPETEAAAATTGEYQTAQDSYAVHVSAQDRYVLRSQDGIICVFSGDGEPVMRTQIAVSSLREVDQKALFGGIWVESIEEVLRLLEDYGS